MRSGDSRKTIPVLAIRNGHRPSCSVGLENKNVDTHTHTKTSGRLERRERGFLAWLTGRRKSESCSSFDFVFLYSSFSPSVSLPSFIQLRHVRAHLCVHQHRIDIPIDTHRRGWLFFYLVLKELRQVVALKVKVTGRIGKISLRSAHGRRDTFGFL